MKINILDSSVYNRISAGEVVENPASIVKELVENAVDAGANAITVRISDGGIKSIEVSDNGAGIPKEELSKTILAHATSKIEVSEDLDSIATLGFRGEALASIAAVSGIEIKSRYYESETGAQLTADGGKNLSVSDAAYNAGTSVKVRNLFFNTPARFKFLKTPKTEGGYIATLMSQFILSNPLVSFRFYADDNLVYQSGGGGLFDAVKAVYPTEIYEKLIELEPLKDAVVSVSGYVSSPECSKNNRSFQTLTVNGRLVTDAGISAAVQNAYSDRLMQHKFPIFVINLLMPFDNVDINVHPNKKEVRFAKGASVNGAVYNAVKRALDCYEQKLISARFSENTDEKATVSVEKAETAADNAPRGQFTPPIFRFDGERTLAFKDNKTSSVDINALIKRAAERKEEREKELREEKEAKESYTAEPFKEVKREQFKIIGQLFGTYLMLESDGKLFIIDQHAAHERLLYDEMLEQADKKEAVSQPLLIPYIYECKSGDSERILEYKDEFTALGFDLEDFGGSIKINAVPLCLTDIKIDAFMRDITEQIRFKSVTAGGILREKLMKAACRAAIKGGDVLTSAQIAALSEYLLKNLPLKCPHGRPVYIVYSKEDIEKTFGRRL